MLEKPLISIVLPTYNRKGVIGRAINSVIRQSYHKWELIIIDDGSTDGTEEFIRTYGNSYNIKYVKQPNRGVSISRNNGISLSKGEYIAFIDSDDEWIERKLEAQLDFFNLHTEIALVFSNANLIKPDGIIASKPEIIKHDRDEIFTLESVFKDPYFGIPTVMIRKDIFDIVGKFDESLNTAEDIDLFLRISLKKSIGYQHDKFANIYISGGSLTSSKGKEKGTISTFENNILVIKRFIEENKYICIENNCDINGAMFNLYCSYARALLSGGNMKQARDKIISAHKYKKSIELYYLFIKTFLKKQKPN